MIWAGVEETPWGKGDGRLVPYEWLRNGGLRGPGGSLVGECPKQPVSLLVADAGKERVILSRHFAVQGHRFIMLTGGSQLAL